VATLKLGKDNFDEVVRSNEIVFVDFWAAWCGPCRYFAPIFEAASEKYPDVVFGKVDTEAEPELAGAFGIMSIPTLMVFRDQIELYAPPPLARAGTRPRFMVDRLVKEDHTAHELFDTGCREEQLSPSAAAFSGWFQPGRVETPLYGPFASSAANPLVTGHESLCRLVQLWHRSRAIGPKVPNHTSGETSPGVAVRHRPKRRRSRRRNPRWRRRS
jgi:thioredoxin 1